MIISCIKCAKKFDIDSELIPEKGRLLQCSSCNHTWSFKKETIHQSITTPIKNNNVNEEVELSTQESKSIKDENPENIKLLDKKIKDESGIEKILKSELDYKNQNDLEINDFKDKKDYNVLGLIIIFIISFISLIIVIDTFQKPISNIIPNTEFLLYSLYETINDIVLFLRDLI